MSTFCDSVKYRVCNGFKNIAGTLGEYFSTLSTQQIYSRTHLYENNNFLTCPLKKKEIQKYIIKPNKLLQNKFYEKKNLNYFLILCP